MATRPGEELVERVDALVANLNQNPGDAVALRELGETYEQRIAAESESARRAELWHELAAHLRGLAAWMSSDDGARLIEACLSTDRPGMHYVWAVSRNTRRWWSLAAGEAIGYFPKDDAEVFAAERIAEFGEPDFQHDPKLNRVGGWWIDHPLGQRMG